jgi:glycosyltransferase involved in cell wall biosynthesis
MLNKANINADSGRPTLLNVVTSPLMVGLLQGQLQYLEKRGLDVIVVSPAGRQLEEVARIEGVRAIELTMARKIAPLSDLVSLFRLCRITRAIRPLVTNVSTPKAGLLGGFAAWVNRVPCRFYTLRGLRFETTMGLKRRLLVFAERLACCLAHRVICVSKSVREKAIASGLTSPERTVVFGSGSSNGVDASRFARTPEMIRRAAELRCELVIPPQAPVVGFVGRLTRDKGIPELTEAFLRLGDQFPDLRLLLLGPFEDEDPLPAETRRCLETHGHVIFAGLVEDTAAYYALMDVFILPSHREGLPNAVLEAQAAGIPVVAARATGVVDAVVDGETGLLFPVGDAAALAEAVARLLSDKALASKLAHAGQERIKREFRQEQIWEALYQEYVRFLQINDLPLPVIPFPEKDGTRRNSRAISAEPFTTGNDLTKRDSTEQRIAGSRIEAAKFAIESKGEAPRRCPI